MRKGEELVAQNLNPSFEKTHLGVSVAGYPWKNKGGSLVTQTQRSVVPSFIVGMAGRDPQLIEF